jgi:hypothetical protein
MFRGVISARILIDHCPGGRASPRRKGGSASSVSGSKINLQVVGKEKNGKPSRMQGEDGDSIS